MQNPSYLVRSRHNVFYFRWPLPRFLWVQGKTRHVKISLQTRDPKEALRLANVLEYHAYVITKHESILLMDHGDILNLLKSYFYELIDQKKAEIHKRGPLPKAETEALLTQLEWTAQAIEQNRDDIIPGEDMHKRLAPIIQRFDVDIFPSLQLHTNMWNRPLLGKTKTSVETMVKGNMAKPIDLRGCDTLAKIRKQVKAVKQVEKGVRTFKTTFTFSNDAVVIGKTRHDLILRSSGGKVYPCIRVDIKGKHGEQVGLL